MLVGMFQAVSYKAIAHGDTFITKINLFRGLLSLYLIAEGSMKQFPLPENLN
jgi:hypothetical protein